MSATNRGLDRIANDNYPTPAWAVYRFLEKAIQRNIPIGGHALEPCAGDGAIIKAVGSWFKPRLHWTAIEIRSECRNTLCEVAQLVHIEDFFGLSPAFRGAYDLVLSNPPFSQAADIIRHAFDWSPWVVMLLRLNFMGSKERHSWLSTNTPDIYVLPNRPPFAVNKHGKVSTDSCEYGWFVWGPHSRGATRGSIELLDETPLSERRSKK